MNQLKKMFFVTIVLASSLAYAIDGLEVSYGVKVDADGASIDDEEPISRIDDDIVAGELQPTATPSLCFRREDNGLLTHQISVLANPPVLAGALRPMSAYYPASIYTSRPSEALPAGVSLTSLHQLWANRCHYVQNRTLQLSDCLNINGKSPGNEDLGIIGRRAIFTSYAKANACTSIQARRLMAGDSDATLREVAGRYGLTFLSRRADMTVYRAQMESVVLHDGTRESFLVDKCIAPTTSESPASGISLDYEVADRRPSQVATALFRSLARTAAASGKIVYAVTQNLGFKANPYGIDRNNFRTILGLVDYFAINIATGAYIGNAGDPIAGIPARPPRPAVRTHMQSYEKTLSEIEMTDAGRVPLTALQRRKVLWGIGLFHTDLDDARLLRSVLLNQKNYGGIAIQRAFVPQGGDCGRTETHLEKTVKINQVIACLSFGICNGQFGLSR